VIKLTEEKDIFDMIKSKYQILDEKQLEKLANFYSNSDDYNRMLISINEFITDLEPNLDKIKIKQKTEDLLRSYPPTLVSNLSKTEKWYLFNNIAHLFLTMAIDSIES
jgi:hypothetical protein